MVSELKGGGREGGAGSLSYVVLNVQLILFQEWQHQCLGLGMFSCSLALGTLGDTEFLEREID